MERKYVIGIDFGTLSGRAMLVAADDGEEIASAVMDYPHGLLETVLPDGRTPLGRDWELQVGGDYIDVLLKIVPEVVEKSGVDPKDIIAVATDCTASTLIPVDKDLVPLSERYPDRPHAYVKLWKHHAAQKEADEINEKITTFPNDVRAYYGERISSEIVLPKALQMLREDPEIYAAADAFLEVPDWLNRLLTGEKKQSASTAGYKAMYFNEKGYPSREFLRRIDPGLEGFVEEKLGGAVCPLDEPFGVLKSEWAEKLKLCPGTIVGCSIIDAHACMIGCGITKPGRMMLVLGTSSVQSALSDKTYSGGGVIGTIRDCIVPGYYAWETGLAAVGDQLSWFAANCAGIEPCTDGEELSRRLEKLTAAADALEPDEFGPIALDWFNGNKTPYVRGDLSGAIFGLRLSTSTARLFRAMIESTAFGTRCILDHFERAGAGIDEIIACGGIAGKNPTLMQIFADVLDREIGIAANRQTGALGACVIAATAAGAAAGGYDSLSEAAEHMTSLLPLRYRPNPDNVCVYDRMYARYLDYAADLGEK